MASYVLALSTVVAALWSPSAVEGFSNGLCLLKHHPSVATFPSTRLASSTTDAAERLLRKARELREAAAAAEKNVHDQILEKKQQHERHTDQLIQHVFSSSEDKTTSVVDRLRAKKCCLETLEAMVLRLDAQDQEDLVDQLIAAVAILDAEHQKQDKIVTEHWGGGQAAAKLQAHVNEVRRERSEQFQKRQKEFQEAQRLKEDNDHKFHGYRDMSTWDPDEKEGF